MADRSKEGDERLPRQATDDPTPAQLLELARKLDLAIAARWRRHDGTRKATTSNVRTLM
jgi:hypothetical protein